MTRNTILRSTMIAAMTAIGISAFASIQSFTAMSTWSPNGDGWLAPGEGGNTWLSNNSSVPNGTNRSIAYNRATGNLLATNDLSVRILNPLTGSTTGFLDMTGISGGTRALNTIGVAADGSIFGANLTTNATSSVYKVYRWANESAAPTLVYSGAPLAGARIGDDLDVIGTGSNVTLVAGYGTNSGLAGTNGYAALTWNGTSVSASSVGFAGTTPASGDFRLGITFGANQNEVFGTQGAGGTAGGRLRKTTFAGTAGTLVASYQLSSASERGLDIANVGGFNLLSTIDTVTSLVRIYNVDTLTTSGANTALASLDLTTTDTTNGNATSALAWGSINGQNATLYALNTNNGIQAFNVQVVPEPATMAVLGLGVAAVLRRKRKNA